MEIKNAVIKGFTLGWEDHGVLTMFLNLDYGGSGQGFGGYSLDVWNKKEGKESGRLGTAWGLQFIMEIMRVVGVNEIHKLVGESIRVKASYDKVEEIGNFLEDVWFNPSRDLEFLLKSKTGN